MTLLRRLPAFLALLLLGALALRLGVPVAAAAPLTLVLVGLLFVPSGPVLAALRLLLGAGAFAWAALTWLRVQERITFGQPWLRLACILGAVALFTA
jgi:hypothetical protein